MRRAYLGETVLAIALVTGCGGDDDTTTTPAIDTADIEPQLLERLAQDAGVDPTGDEMDCPSGEPAEEGHEFKCTLTAADGSTATVRVTITQAVVSGDELHYEYDAVVPKGQFK
jgi:Domain of unknown function (DUF4333)